MRLGQLYMFCTKFLVSDICCYIYEVFWLSCTMNFVRTSIWRLVCSICYSVFSRRDVYLDYVAGT
jgi:hypothetical protein